MIGLVAGMIVLVMAQNVSADVIMPGYHTLPVSNKIVNINDFPDYVFVNSGHEFLGPPMCSRSVVGDDGLVLGGGYKLCEMSVYAVKKSEFAEFNETLSKLEDDLSQAERPSNKILNATAIFNEYKNYFSEHSIKVMEITHSLEVGDSDARESITNIYTLNPDLSVGAKQVIVERNFLFYVYIIAPIVALALIVLYLARRKK